jgi:hypothetical protein
MNASSSITRRWSLLLAGVASVIPASLAGQTSACESAEHAQFDFWVGEWRVERASDSAVVGHNIITKKLGGCVLHESYTTPAGYAGESLNIYDGSRGVWHQTWVDVGGLLLRLDGGLRGEAMVMEGPGKDAQGREIINKISWSVVDGDPDRVRQHWEVSGDGGDTWTTAFDGIYVRL